MATIELTCMDHFIRASTDVDGAYAAVTRLGLTATNPGPAADTGAHYSVVTLGGHENRVFVEYMTHHDPVAAAADPGMADIVPLLEAGGGMRQLVFVVDDLAAARETFGAQTAGFTESVSKVADGRWEVRGLTPGDSTAAGCRFGIIQYQPEMLAAMEQAAPRTHEFPLKRVDHIAIIPADFDEGTRYWTETLGAPLHAELQGPGFLIRQMAVGDMMVELLAPTGPDSPLAAAPPGLLPVLACEVDDLAACVELARSRGFTPPDPGPGALPDTLVSTIPAGETGGIQYQLLQYV